VEAAARAVELGTREESVSALHAAIVVLAPYNEREVLEAFAQGEVTGILAAVGARAAVEVRDFDTALRLLEGAEAPARLAVCGWLHLQRYEYHEALTCLRQARQEGFSGPSLLVNLGFARAAMGNLHKPIKATREAVAVAPGNRVAG
jgi:hypothetical protein